MPVGIHGNIASMPAATSDTKTETKKVQKPAPPDIVDRFPEIRGIMRERKWNNAARLMDQWFANPANENLDWLKPHTTTIKMDPWVLTFPRARSVYDQMLREQIWINKPTQGNLANKMRNNGYLQNATTYVGNVSLPAPLVQDYYANIRLVSSDPMSPIC